MTRTIHNDRYRLLLGLMQQVREASGLTQTALARRLGTTQSYVSKCERGERRIDIMEFIRYCDGVGVDAGVLLDALLDRVCNAASAQGEAAAVTALLRRSKRKQRMRGQI